jgi:hypothetical protein
MGKWHRGSRIASVPLYNYKVINSITSIMYPSEISGVIVSSEEFGCAYTVCTEGELFYAPVYEDGSISTMEFDFVDFDSMDEETAEKVERIHSVLIDMMSRAGLYFRQPVGHC